MTSVLPMHIVGISEKAISHYRDSVAPLIKNNWNRLSDFLFKSRIGHFITISSFLLFLVVIGFGGWLSQYIPHEIVLLGAVPGLFLFGVSRLSEDFNAKPPLWYRSSVMEYLAEQQPSAAEVTAINGSINVARASNPSVEFDVEYLQPGTEKRPLPKAMILWENSQPLDAQKKSARLVLQDGKLLDLHQLAHYPLVPPS